MPHHFSTEKSKVYLAGGILMLLLWVVDATIDAYFEKGSPLQQLLDPSLHEVSMRLAAAVLLLIFLFIFARILESRRRLEQTLETVVARADLEKARSDAILAEMGDGISIQDTDFKIIYQNRAHQALRGEHLGEYCYAAYQGRHNVCDECHLALSFADGQTHFRETSASTGAGVQYVEIISTPLRDMDGKIIAGIEAVRDVTPRKLMEEEIRALNEDLLRNTVELSATNKELEAFNYSLSHDLRTLLTRLFIAAQGLEEGYSAKLDETGRFFTATICKASENMDALLESMLVLSGVTRSELSLAEVDLSLLAGEIVAGLRMAEPEREVEIRVTPALVVIGDLHLLRVALENLLGNAWKFTQKTAGARIEFGITERAGETAYYVRDNGAGFPMNDADQLFKPFKRLHKADDFAGTGIGLATVQRIIERHDGRIWGEGEVGRGAAFYLTLNSRLP
jgi:signal transduction histidine kinase